MDWNDIRHFLALARTGSVRAAGATLGVSHSTVARRVEALEERLGTRLFDRGPDGFTLTAAGARMLPGAERVEAELTALERSAVGQDERLAGVLAVTCVDTFMSRLLVGPLAALCARHADLELQLTADSRRFDLARREADLALRATSVDASPQDSLVGQRVAPIVVASYVSAEGGDFRDPECAGSAPRFLGFDDGRAQQEAVRTTSYPEAPLWGAFPSIELMVQAAEHGLGIALLPTYVGDQVPTLRRLTRPDVRHLGDLWMVHHPDLRTNARVRAARDVVRETLRQHADLFAGRRPIAATVGPENAPGTPARVPVS